MHFTLRQNAPRNVRITENITIGTNLTRRKTCIRNRRNKSAATKRGLTVCLSKPGFQNSNQLRLVIDRQLIERKYHGRNLISRAYCSARITGWGKLALTLKHTQCADKARNIVSDRVGRLDYPGLTCRGAGVINLNSSACVLEKPGVSETRLSS